VGRNDTPSALTQPDHPASKRSMRAKETAVHVCEQTPEPAGSLTRSGATAALGIQLFSLPDRPVWETARAGSFSEVPHLPAPSLLARRTRRRLAAARPQPSQSCTGHYIPLGIDHLACGRAIQIAILRRCRSRSGSKRPACSSPYPSSLSSRSESSSR
jgi:hypothetical protein